MDPAKPRKTPTALRQASLFNLKGVVVIEDIARDKKDLENPDIDSSRKASILKVSNL